MVDVLDLNRVTLNAVGSQGSALGAEAQSVNKTANQNALSGFSSFMETLSSVQEATAAFQSATLNADDNGTGTRFGTPVMQSGSNANVFQQFQRPSGFNSFDTASSFTPSAGSAAEFSNQSRLPGQAKSGQSEMGADSMATKTDTYVKSGSSAEHNSVDNQPSQGHSVPFRKVQAVGSKQTLKTKQHKETAGFQVPPSSEAAGTGLTVTDSGSTDKVAGAMQATSASVPVVSDNAGAPSERTRTARVADPDSTLAFAVKIQGNDRNQLSGAATVSGVQATSGALPADSQSYAGDVANADVLATQVNATAFSGQRMGGDSGSSNQRETNQSEAMAMVTGAQASAGATTSTPDAEMNEPVAAAPEPKDDPTPTSQPLKAVQVQITGADNQRVDLRLMEKSGTLTMSVRSSDGSLTKTLQQNLPQLSEKLSDQQIHAEWWKPDIQTMESTPSARSASSGSQSNDTSAQDQGNQSQGNSGQQGGRNAKQPDWLEELADLRKSTQNGKQYSWHL